MEDDLKNFKMEDDLKKPPQTKTDQIQDTTLFQPN